jgi:hypothetical protein
MFPEYPAGAVSAGSVAVLVPGLLLVLVIQTTALPVRVCYDCW